MPCGGKDNCKGGKKKWQPNTGYVTNITCAGKLLINGINSGLRLTTEHGSTFTLFTKTVVRYLV